MVKARQSELDAMRDRAEYWAKGRAFEDFHLGQVFDHRWSRTLTESDTIQFSTQTLYFHAPCFSRLAARDAAHRAMLINPFLVLNVAIGLSVEDLSEAGGPFVALENVRFLAPVLAGDTLRGRSTTIAAKATDSRPEFGLVTWRTEAFDQDGSTVVSLERSNLVLKSAPQRARYSAMLGHERIRLQHA